MTQALTVIFFDDYFICTAQTDEADLTIIDINEQEKPLLYFYKDNQKLVNNEHARSLYEANDPQAFSFYDAIFKNLEKSGDAFYDANYFVDHLVLQIKDAYWLWAEDDDEKDILLNICFIPEVLKPVTKVIVKAFERNGFIINAEADYHRALYSGLVKREVADPKKIVGVVESYFGDLIFRRFATKGEGFKAHSKTAGKWDEITVNKFARLLVETAIQDGNSQLGNRPEYLEAEIKQHLAQAATEIKKFKNRKNISVKIALTDGVIQTVLIERTQLDIDDNAAENICNAFYDFIAPKQDQSDCIMVFLNSPVSNSWKLGSFFKLKFGAKNYTNLGENDKFLKLLIFAIAGEAIIKPVPFAQPAQNIQEKPSVVQPAPPPKTTEGTRSIEPISARAFTKPNAIYGTIIILLLIVVCWWFIKRRPSFEITTNPSPSGKVGANTSHYSAKSADSLYQAGNNIYLHGRLRPALSLFEASVNIDSNAKAECMIGNLYHEGGKGVTKDDGIALQWYLKAGAKNNPVALYSIGMLYISGGKDVQQDFTAARKYLKLSIRYANGNKKIIGAAIAKLAMINNVSGRKNSVPAKRIYVDHT